MCTEAPRYHLARSDAGSGAADVAADDGGGEGGGDGDFEVVYLFIEVWRSIFFLCVWNDLKSVKIYNGTDIRI